MRISRCRALIPHRSLVAVDAARVWTAELEISELLAVAEPLTILERVAVTGRTLDRVAVFPKHMPRVLKRRLVGQHIRGRA